MVSKQTPNVGIEVTINLKHRNTEEGSHCPFVYTVSACSFPGFVSGGAENTDNIYVGEKRPGQETRVRTLSVVYPRIQNMGSRSHVALHRLHNYARRINILIKLNALPIGYFALERSDSFSFSSIS